MEFNYIDWFGVSLMELLLAYRYARKVVPFVARADFIL
jgi:hypothetical protein